MKTVRYRAMWLTVAEAKEIVVALENAKVLKCLDGSQRQHIDGVVSRLSRLIVDASSHEIELTTDLAVQILRSVSVSQKWLNSMFDDFGNAEQ